MDPTDESKGHVDRSREDESSGHPVEMDTLESEASKYKVENDNATLTSEETRYEANTSQFIKTNPMMERIRLTLKEQLIQTRERVKLELIEQEDVLKKATREREDAGVELYGVQQQLSRLQSNLNSLGKQYDKVSKERTEGQKKVSEAKKRYADRLKEAERLRLEEAKSREKLDSMLEKIRQAKKYNDEMKSEVAVTRTAANKTVDDLKVKAKDKLAQDTYIDSLNSQVTRLEDDIALTESQLRAQKEQSADADKMIRETSEALEKLASEKRRLIQQWNSSVVALGRRDQALAAASNALKKVQDSIKKLDGENSRFKRDIASLEEERESLKTISDRLHNEIEYTESNIEKVKSNLVTLSEKFDILQESLKNTLKEEKDVDSEICKVEKEIDVMNNKCELLIRERHAIEEKIAATRLEQSNISKAAQNLAKAEKSLLAKINEKEIDSASILNDIAKIDADRLNAQSHNAQLEEKLKQDLGVMKAMEAQIDSLESEIKQCNDEIEKKNMRVAKLNREYSVMMKAYEDEDRKGPLEATIKTLSNEIEMENAEISRLQKDWLIHQTELIKIIGKTNAIQEKDSESSDRFNILRQKALRLVQNIHSNEATIKSIEANTSGLHKDISRLNDLIEKNTRDRLEYANKLAVNSMEFERELADLQEQSIRLERQSVDVKTNRDKLLGDMNEIESQIKTWEQKIRIEKETQAQLHTSKDAIDTKGMQKEIKRMKHKLDSLTRTQEQLLREMELAIHKREDIAVKYENRRSSRSDSQQGMTKGELEKKVEIATSQLQRLDHLTREALSTVTKTREDLAAIRTVLHDTEAKYDSASKLCDTLSQEVDEKKFEQTRLQSMCELQDEILKRYEALSKGQLPPVGSSAKEEFMIEKEHAVSKANMTKVSNVISSLTSKFDRYETIFSRLNLLASDVLSD